MGFLRCRRLTLALASYCCLFLDPRFRKADLGQRALMGPAACLTSEVSEESRSKPPKSDSAAVRCGYAVCPRQRWALAGDRLKISKLSLWELTGLRKVLFLL